jgi:general stress protein 26
MAGTDSSAERVIELAEDIHVSMLTTIDGDGHFVSRPMGQQAIDDDSAMWFFAERGSRKVAHIVANPYVNVTLASSDTWISISGTARIIDDVTKAKQLWNGFVEAWLPQGPEDPSVVLIAVTGETGEYWDTPGGRIATAISFAKAKLTGERYDGGENETVQFEK